MKRALWLLALALVALFAGGTARAAQVDDPSFTISADTDTFDVGDALELRVQVVSSIETPQSPTLALGHGLTIERTMTGQTELVTVMNGVAVQRHGLTITWVLRATAVGITGATPTVTVAGARHSAKRVTLHVTPAGTHAHKQAQRPNPMNPFGGLHGPFGGFDPFRDLFGSPEDDEPPIPAPKPATDPALSLSVAPAPLVFLRASVDKTSVVVGEQVVLAIDMYSDTGMVQQPGLDILHEATTADFVRHSLMIDDSKLEPMGMADVAGSIWAVGRLRKMALFPIKAGELRIEPMQAALSGVRMPARATEPITIHVVDPPAEGRPPGYALGDVGRFTLAAEVTPRRVKRGEVVSVTVDLGGVGNVPDRLTTPARSGVEWLEPEVHDKLGRVDANRWGGSRTLTYVVRMTAEGNVDLGELALAYWDPQRKVYDTARAVLGSIEVLPGSAPAASASSRLPDLPGARATLTRATVRAHTDDSPWFWGLLAGPALVFASAAGARAAGKRVAARIAERNASPSRELERRVRDAEEACRGKDARAVDAAIVRALEHATIARRGVNVRGMTRAVALEALASAGVDAKIARELFAVLEACEAARFSPEGAEIGAARDRWTRAKAALEAL